MTLKSYIVTAHQHGQEPVRIPVLAFDAAMAISTIQELYPLHLISTALLAPEWEDDLA